MGYDNTSVGGILFGGTPQSASRHTGRQVLINEVWAAGENPPVAQVSASQCAGPPALGE